MIQFYNYQLVYDSGGIKIWEYHTIGKRYENLEKFIKSFEKIGGYEILKISGNEIDIANIFWSRLSGGGEIYWKLVGRET